MWPFCLGLNVLTLLHEAGDNQYCCFTIQSCAMMFVGAAITKCQPLAVICIPRLVTGEHTIQGLYLPARLLHALPMATYFGSRLLGYHGKLFEPWKRLSSGGFPWDFMVSGRKRDGIFPLGAVQRDCQWLMENDGNSHSPPEPKMHCKRGIFHPANHKRAMLANWMPCLIPHWQSYSHQ